jgi:DNA end-binding protein Ku
MARSSTAKHQRTREPDERGKQARPVWTGALKLSLITIPVRVYLATNPGSDVRFRQLHRKCHTPIQLKKWCPHCNQEIGADEIVKGYEVAKGRYALVEDEEIASLRPESTKMIDLSHTVEASAVDPLYIERAYFLSPESKTAGGAFAVLREALGDRAAVGRMAVHGREYLVAVVPRDAALVAYTLRTKGEVRNLTSIDGLDFAEVKTKPDEVTLARRVLGSLETAPDLSEFTDHYEEALRAMVETKREQEVVAAETGAAPKKVVNLMDALRRSLAEAEGKRPRRGAGGRHMARVLPHKRRKAG